MTAQAADVLWVDGRRLMLFTNPLESFWSETRPRPKFVAPLTSLYRGYIATWLIEDGRLYLTAIDGAIAANAEGGIVSGRRNFMQETVLENLQALATTRLPASVALLFPGGGDRVHAEWFTGVLRVPEGEQIQHVHAGYASVFERERHITIENGLVTHSEVIDADEVRKRQEADYRRSLDRVRPALPNERGWITCPHCGRIFRVSDGEDWDGERHKCGGRVVLQDADAR